MHIWLEGFGRNAFASQQVKTPVLYCHVEISPPVGDRSPLLEFFPQSGETFLNDIFRLVHIGKIMQGIDAQRSEVVSEQTLEIIPVICHAYRHILQIYK